MRVDLPSRAALALALGLLACPAASPPPEPVDASASSPPEDFSEERAWRHLEALGQLGPRPTGSEGSARARGYLVAALRDLGLEATQQRGPTLPEPPADAPGTVNLVARLPGTSPDLILLVAPYDSPPAAEAAPAGDGASGAALVLELGRALQARGPLYTVVLGFVEGDALASSGGRSAGLPPESVGTGALLAALAAEEGLDRVRLAVRFDRVAEPGLRIARDLLSSRNLREEFWAAAHRLGHTSVFPPRAPFEAVQDAKGAFAGRGMRRFVAIVGSPLPPATAPEAPEDARAQGGESAARASLAAVGAVSLDAIAAISQRLAKIDRFAQSPLSERPGSAEPAAAAPPPAPPAPDAQEAAAP